MKITSPWTDLTPGKYHYSMPEWTTPREVEVIAGEGAFSGKLLVRFTPGMFPMQLSDVHCMGFFDPIKSNKV